MNIRTITITACVMSFVILTLAIIQIYVLSNDLDQVREELIEKNKHISMLSLCCNKIMFAGEPYYFPDQQIVHQAAESAVKSMNNRKN